MYLRPVFLCLAVVGQAIGVKITHPTTGSNWTTTGEFCHSLELPILTTF
jgi:hypothetical protein